MFVCVELRGEGGRECKLSWNEDGGGGSTEGRNFYYHTCTHFKHFRDFM